MDIFDNPQINQLLQQAESAVRMLGQVDSYGKRQVKHALTGIYEDIGKHVHALSRQLANDDPSMAMGTGRLISVNELEELTSEIENTDEVGQERIAADSPIDFSSPDWLESHRDVTPISVEHVEAHLKRALAHIQLKLAANDAEVSWVYELEGLLDMLDMSENLDDETEIALEATKLQSATTNVYDTWPK
jgi:hypothetical protein